MSLVSFIRTVTVGFVISTNRLLSQVAGCTASEEFHLALKQRVHSITFGGRRVSFIHKTVCVGECGPLMNYDEDMSFDNSAVPTSGSPRQEFGLRLAAAMREHGPLCVGIDPHRKNLHDWGYNIDAEGAELFSMRMLQGAQGRAAAVKFQMPMFERYGSKGYAALERALYAARQMELITIVDCLRGGLPTTLSSIADAYLKPDGPLYTDAITLLPYYGFHSLDGLVNDALNNGCGVFVASLTPNPEGAHLQSAIRQAGEYAGQTVAYGIAQDAQKYNAEFPDSMGSVGLIIGASIGKWMKEGGVDPAKFTGPILSPGYGWQGATDDDLKTVFAGTHGNVLVTVARSIAAHGPDIDELSKAVTAIGDEVRRAMDVAQHAPHPTQDSDSFSVAAPAVAHAQGTAQTGNDASAAPSVGAGIVHAADAIAVPGDAVIAADDVEELADAEESVGQATDDELDEAEAEDFQAEAGMDASAEAHTDAQNAPAEANAETQTGAQQADNADNGAHASEAQ